MFGELPKRYEGKVKFFEAEKGYGFIKRDDGGRDVFVHKKTLDLSLRTTLREGNNVSFELVETAKGPSAQNVWLLP